MVLGYAVNMKNIIEMIRKTLKAEACGSDRIDTQRWFKEEIKAYGLKAADVRKIAKTYFVEVKDLPKEQLFVLCESLWQSSYLEESGIACEWICRIHKDLKPKDWTIFDRWVDVYITNWARCDTFCGDTVGTFLEMYPQYLRKLPMWAKSKNLWKRRAAAVSLIKPARKGLFHENVFEIAEILLRDTEDMVQKGYGWMLKEASNVDQQSVFRFVMEHKAVMPRTALRYAIEKMPKNLKERAMK
jgi:3-methyladenine DNA glycosylase AlkD